MVKPIFHRTADYKITIEVCFVVFFTWMPLFYPATVYNLSVTDAYSNDRNKLAGME